MARKRRQKNEPLTDDELLAAVDAAESAALGSEQSAISTDRTDALDRYLGKQYAGDLAAPPGRSSVVSRDVADVVEGVLANVLKPFVGGDEIVRFDPNGPDDEEQSQQETDYVNWVALQRNNGFLTLNSAVKDALLLRMGYVKMAWTQREDVVLETYSGLGQEELAMILQDKDVEVIGHNEYPDPAAMVMAPQPMMPMLHDLKLRRIRQAEYVETLPTPPEEILVSQRQRSPSLQDCDFVQHRTHKTLSELREMGYDVPDDITDDDSNQETIEDMARQRQSPGNIFADDPYDTARRYVLFKETWMRIDRDGDGISELRRICQVGRTLLNDEETELIPIAAFCPILMQHQHPGISVYDMIEDLAKLKTSLMRQFMDNKYLSNNSRMGVGPGANIDDVLVHRPGGMIRTDGPPGESLMPITVPDTGPSALQGLEYLDTVKENRTGYTRQTQGLSSDTLSTETLGGQVLQLTQSQLRMEMIARTIAETGVRDMFLIIHALTLKHSTRAEKIKLRNKWVVVDPRQWVKRHDLSISVGIGSSSQQTMMSALGMIAQAQEKAMPLGIVNPDNVYNLVKKLTNAAGFKNVDEFFTVPQKNPQTGKAEMPPPRPPDSVLVEQERQKGDAMKTQATLGHEQQLAVLDAQMKEKELALQAKYKEMEAQHALMLQQSNDQRQSALDQQKHALDMQKIQMEQELQIQLANIKAAASVEVARIGQGVDDGTSLLRQQEVQAGYKPILDALQQIMVAASAPKEVVRDAQGRVVGVRAIGNQTIQ